MRMSFLWTLCLLIGLSTAAYSQRPGSSPPGQTDRPNQAQPAQGDKVSLTGCLTKGSQANQYVITDSASHKAYPFPGPPQLDAYVNQTVRLTGSLESRDNGDKVFRPESIAPVSASCS